MTPLEISLVSAIVPLIIALTAWLRAEVANRTSNSAKVTAHQAAAVASNVSKQLGGKPLVIEPTEGDGK